MNESPVLVWFQHDLRVADNRALDAAVRSGSPVIPVFVWAPEEDAPWAPGSASRWWLHHSLEALGESLRRRGSKLIIRRGLVKKELLRLAAETDAAAIYWNRVYEPPAMAQGQELRQALQADGLAAESFSGNLLFEPGTIRNSSGKPFTVFTPFWKACLRASAPSAPTEPPKTIPAPRKWPKSLAVSDLELLPAVDWAAGMRETWRPGEDGAKDRLRAFLHRKIEGYADRRDRPDLEGTSRLSPHLHFGEVGPRQIWHAAQRHDPSSRETYLRQIVWREFAHHLLFHYPETSQQPLRPDFRFFPWRVDERSLEEWTRGRTGYPIVDAGMRELWKTGWMHNRVRMIVGSFLVKDLLIPWQEGARWFWDTLVDADLANNTLGWQWVAGCGADAAPYFRIFNPVLQGQKFDPNGVYIRRWVPELSDLPAAWIHQPCKAPPPLLRDAGVKLGATYPQPIVVHETARRRALAALEHIQSRVRSSP